MFRKKILNGLCLATMTVTFCACSINVPPPDLYSDPNAINSIKSARSLLTSCYLLYPHYEYELSTIGNDFCLTNLSGKDVEQQNLYLWQDNTLSNFASESWLTYYNCIANCDILLDRLPNVKLEQTSDSTMLNNIKAEGKTLKAMAYFDILRLFSSAYDNTTDQAGMIIKTKTGVEDKARSSKTESVNYIKGLLTEAATVNNTPTSNGWLSQKAAIYLLAEVSLYEGNYENAAKYAQQLIDVCDASYIDKNNYERIWDSPSYAGRIFAFNVNSSYYASIQYSDEGDYFAVNPEFTYSENDGRKNWAIYPKTISGINHNLLGKYNKTNKENGTISYINRMRYAGAYFIAAEAYARLKKDNIAIKTINTYLNAEGANPLSENLTGDELIQSILKEKYKEFVGEGQNYFDLKRTHAEALPRYAAWGNSTRSTIQSTDYRWTFPIPASEYRYNNAVTQNNGWPINRN